MTFRRPRPAKIFILLLRAGGKSKLIHINPPGISKIIVPRVARLRGAAHWRGNAQKAREPDAHYRPPFADARIQPVAMGAHLTAN